MTSTEIIRTVTRKLQDKEGYPVWALQTEIYLAQKKLDKHIHEFSEDHARAARNEILALLDDSLILEFSIHDKPLVLWNEIKARFGSSSQLELAQLEDKIRTLRFVNVEQLTSQLNNLYARLSQAGYPRIDSKKFMDVLNCLPAAYAGFREIAITWDEPRRTYRDILSALRDVETIRGPNQKVSTQPILVAEVSKPTCFNCGSSDGHWRSQCPFIVRPKGTPIKSWTPVLRKAEVPAPENTPAPNLFAQTNPNKLDLLWYLDSGASFSTTFDITAFVELQTLKSPVNVQAANGVKTLAHRKGTVKIEAIVKGKPKSVTISNVLYVPEFKFQLLSVRAATDAGHTVTFTKETATIANDRGDVILEAVGDSGALWSITTVPNQLALSAFHRPTKEYSINELHSIMGHIDHSHLHKAVANGLIKGPVLNNKPWAECEACAKAKFTRPSFPQSKTVAIVPGQIIVADVCGKISPASFGGAQYTSQFQDVHTGFIDILPLQQKDSESVLHHFAYFKSWFEKTTGFKIKTLRSDNGREYTSDTFQSFLKTEGIIWQSTAVATPEQNGIAERAHRTIFANARAMLNESGLEPKFWAEAIRHFVYIFNRIPHSRQKTSPFEAVFKQRPTLTYLLPFGSRCCTENPDQQTKLQNPGVIGIFLGCENHSKSYRVFIPESNRVMKSPKIVLLSPTPPNSRNEPLHIESEVDNTTESEVTLNQNFTPEPIPDEQNICSTETEADPPTRPEVPLRDASSRIQEIRRSNRLRGLPAFTEPQMSSEKNKTTFDKDLLTEEATQSEDALTLISPESGSHSILDTPKISEALKGPQRSHWLRAINDEMRKLIEKGVVKPVIPPLKANILPNKIVLKIKRDGSFKARITAGGHRQKKGIDYDETYAPVVQFTTLRILLTVASARNWHARHIDYEAAYLNAPLHHPVYMRQIKGCEIGPPGSVLAVEKALYGLCQSGHEWWKMLSKAIINGLNVQQSEHDPCVFFDTDKQLYLALYVDDTFLFSPDKKTLDEAVSKLALCFEIKDLGTPTDILGCRFENSALDQQAYTQKLIAEALSPLKRAASSPLPKCIPKKNLGNVNETEKTKYQKLVGSLLHLSRFTRPDIAFAVNVASRYASNPSIQHFEIIERIFRYLKGTQESKLCFKALKENPLEIQAFSDSDYAMNPDDRTSTSGLIILLSGCPIHWASKKQRSVCLSAAEAEYVALSEAARDCLGIVNKLKEWKFQMKTPVIFCDSTSAVQIATQPSDLSRTRHLEIRHHFIRQALNEYKFQLERVGTAENLADIFTKGLAGPPTSVACAKLRMNHAKTIEQNASDTNQPITSKKYEENHKTISELETHKLARTEY